MFMPDMLWSLYFIQAQGYKAECVGLYQDNISTQLLIKNGKMSSGKKTKHIKANSFTSYLLDHLFSEMGLLTPHTIFISCLLEYVKS